MQPDNPEDKYLVCVKKNDRIIRHLQLRKRGNFAKTIFYCLRTDEYSFCEVAITRKPVNLGDGDRMQVSCELNFTGRSKFVSILKKTLKN